MLIRCLACREFAVRVVTTWEPENPKILETQREVQYFVCSECSQRTCIGFTGQMRIRLIENVAADPQAVH